jgi:hypothetical protein
LRTNDTAAVLTLPLLLRPQMTAAFVEQDVSPAYPKILDGRITGAGSIVTLFYSVEAFLDGVKTLAECLSPQRYSQR